MSFYDALHYCKEQVDKAKADGKMKVLVPVAEVRKKYSEKVDSMRFRFVLDELSHIFRVFDHEVWYKYGDDEGNVYDHMSLEISWEK